jgi:hypothetical protein
MNRRVKVFLVSLAVAAFLEVMLSRAALADITRSSIMIGSDMEAPWEERMAIWNLTGKIAEISGMTGEYYAFDWLGQGLSDPDHIRLAAHGNGYNYSIVFSIGHGTVWSGWHLTWQFPLICTHTNEYKIKSDDSYGTEVSDYDIYDDSSERRVRLAFLWSCFQGNEIGTNVSYPCGVTMRGMPYAWLHTSSLSNNGYSSPDNGGYAFIGFDGKAPFLTYDGFNTTVPNQLFVNDTCYYFAYLFYFASLCCGEIYSVKIALDYASQLIWYANFQDTPLCHGYGSGEESGRMVMYGDGNLHVSSYSPSGGCPILYVFDGSEYDCEGLLYIHNPEGTDVRMNHVLETVPCPERNAYLLRLVEHPSTRSHIDRVRLYAMLEDGSVVGLSLLSAFHSRDGNVFRELFASDDRRIGNLPGDMVDLKFKALRPEARVSCFMFEIEGYNPDEKE